MFVTNKGFVYVVPMKQKSKVLQAVNCFVQEVGAPEAMLYDAARQYYSKEIRKFCNDIGTTIHILEDNTPWANITKLYIGIIRK